MGVLGRRLNGPGAVWAPSVVLRREAGLWVAAIKIAEGRGKEWGRRLLFLFLSWEGFLCCFAADTPVHLSSVESPSPPPWGKSRFRHLGGRDRHRTNSTNKVPAGPQSLERPVLEKGFLKSEMARAGKLCVPGGKRVSGRCTGKGLSWVLSQTLPEGQQEHKKRRGSARVSFRGRRPCCKTSTLVHSPSWGCSAVQCHRMYTHVMWVSRTASHLPSIPRRSVLKSSGHSCELACCVILFLCCAQSTVFLSQQFGQEPSLGGSLLGRGRWLSCKS